MLENKASTVYDSDCESNTSIVESNDEQFEFSPLVHVNPLRCAPPLVAQPDVPPAYEDK
jgi:hypothetical protein